MPRSACRARAGTGARPRQREGGRAPVPALLGRRPDARPGDAVDRRGDGHRPRLPDRLRQGRAGRRTAAAGRGHACSSRCATPTSRRRPCWRRCSSRSDSSSWPRRAPPARCSGSGSRCESVPKVTEGSPNVVDLIRSGDINLVINTPAGRGARTDGYEIRDAAIAHHIPCITTLAGASAGVQAIAQARTVPPTALQDIHAACRGRMRSLTRRSARGRRRRGGRRLHAAACSETTAATVGRSRPVLHAPGRAGAGRRLPAAGALGRMGRRARDRLPDRRARRRHARARRRRAGRVLGPLGNGFDPAPGPRCWSAAGSARRCCRGCTGRCRGGRRRRPLLGFRARRTRCARRWSTPSATVVLEPELVTEPLARHAAVRRHRVRLRAGSDAAGRRRALRRARRPCRLAMEAAMACGFGACYGCAVRIDGELEAAVHRGPRAGRGTDPCLT